MKKILAMVLSLVMLLSMSTVCFAVEPLNDNIQTFAVSGQNSLTANNGTFYVYSPGSSWFAHMTFTVSGNGSQDVVISVVNPEGKVMSDFGGAGSFQMSQGTTRSYNFNNGPAGNYRVTFATYGSDVVTVKASLHDWWQ